MSSSNAKPEWRTTANIITLVRIFLIPVFVVVLLAPWPEWVFYPSVTIQDSSYIDLAIKPWVAAFIYATLALTDGVDGYIARKRNEITTFGKFIDPIADKILVAAALLALIELGDLPSWVVLVIIAREFLISGLRLIAAADGIVVAARKSGKVKTALTMLAILMFIVKRSTILMEVDPGFYATFYMLSWLVMIAALVMTVLSLFQYFVQINSAINDSKDKEQSLQEESEVSDDALVAIEGMISEAVLDVRSEDSSGSSQESRGAGESGESGGAGGSEPSLTERAAELLEHARSQGVHIATAESCTGGLIGATLTEIAGSSDVYEGGIISYAYAVKESELGVSADSLAQYGAVSEQVALEMVEGVLRELLSDFDDNNRLAVAVTGVAGPGQSESKPAGTVWFGICGRGPAQAELKQFSGDRHSVREQTVAHALAMMEARLN